ncbi:MAG: GNAT family N-acetyltransferase [Spirochaetaceae bacterium]
MIREATINDAQQICEIYNHYIENTDVTFEEKLLKTSDMVERMSEVLKTLPWLVYTENNKILGYAYASKWKSRIAYKFSVESTVYISEKSITKGLGTKLYKALIEELKVQNIHCVIGGIALPNDKSCGLHEKLGFEKVAQFPEVGFKFNRWIDVGYWQLNI